MTDLLKKPFDAVSALPPERQNALTELILAEIEDEEQWDEAFAGSQDKLAVAGNGPALDAALQRFGHVSFAPIQREEKQNHILLLRYFICAL